MDATRSAGGRHSTFRAFLCSGWIYAVSAAPAQAQEPSQGEPPADSGAATPAAAAVAAEVTLERALELAFANSPRLRVEAARVDEARGRLQGAETFPFNPEFEVSGAARRGPDETTADVEAGLSQELELGGQRGRRMDAARAELRAAESGERAFRRLLAAEVHLAFADALEARELAAIARAQAELAGQLLDIARRRLEAGAGTLLDLNVAAAEVGRAEHALAVAEGLYAAARAALAGAMGASDRMLPSPTGEIGVGSVELPALDALLASAEANRADLEALSQLEVAARARLDLARAEAVPNLRVGVFVGREASAETLIGGGLAIPLPLFQRNQGSIAEARAAAVRAEAEHDAARRSVAYELIAAYEQHQAGARALANLRERVVGTTEESLELLRKAFESGKATSTDVLVLRRTLFEARQAVAEASAQVRRARIRIDVAAGRLALPGAPRVEPAR